ncbi:MAG TPA: threonine dehydratase [Candidatus Elarobacter sp.]|nr:threonine dehydratase [Candidatus Elarobacter sp.]
MSTPITIAELEAAAALVHSVMPPTPQYRWPLLAARAECDVVVKHENHTPLGAFKVRGGLVYMEHLASETPHVRGVVSATRGNHGQSIAFAARRHAIPVTIVVPHGNSVEKNAAMRALGAELIEAGRDFQESAEAADAIARERSLHRLPSFHPWLVSGVATYSLELLREHPDLDALYVPIGLGSGICGAIAARDALGVRTRIIGVVAEGAPAYALSVESGSLTSHDVTTVIADGMACRTPVAEALAIIAHGVDHIVRVSDAQIEEAMRICFTDTHNVAEGAGAAAHAALMKERTWARGRKVGVVLSGGNVDRDVFARVLAAGGNSLTA